MQHKSLNILIQYRFSKFFSINNFDLPVGWKRFFGGVSSLVELFFSKLYISITKNKEKHA